VAFEAQSLVPPLYYGYRIGKQVGPGWLSLEAELIHAKAYAQLGDVVGGGRSGGRDVRAVPVTQHLQRLAMSHGLNFLLLNGVLRHRLGQSPLVVIGRAGIGAVVPHAETESAEGRVEEYQLGGPAVQAAGGMEIRLYRSLYAAAEYKYSYGRPRINIAGGDATITTRSHHATIGVTVVVGR
jgi:hypothetical protein